MTQQETYTVLIIDDSPEQIRYVSELLRTECCRVHAALSCEAAFKLLERQLPDLILLDIVMPNMDGFTFCRQIKSDKRTADIPVIFTTAYTDKEYIGKSFAAGGSDYVVKPFIKEELLERVKVRIRLSQKEKELKRAYDELDKFCYTVSHDIRAPLYVIQQLSELLVREAGEENYEEVQKICGMLMEKARKTATMTEGLHRFSKVFYQKLNFEYVDMDALFHDVFNELVMLEKDRKIEYAQEKLMGVLADTSLIRLVVQNILSNALKFTRNQAQTRIEVISYREMDKLVYSVRDNGIGFDTKYSEEIFQVFRKLHSDREYEGDGIGLASVRRIVLRHGGDVRISSVPGEGTTVEIVLPERQADKEEAIQ